VPQISSNCFPHTTGDTLPILHTAQTLHVAISTSVECLNKQTEGRHFEHQDETKAQVHHWVQMCPLAVNYVQK